MPVGMGCPPRFPLVARVLLSLATLFPLSVVNGQIKSGPYRPDAVGLYVLPQVVQTELPRSCFDHSAACRAEAAGDYETAIRLHEEKYDVCGDVGWSLQGHAAGSNDYVVFKTTPCGLPVAVKAARRTAKECHVLKNLTLGTAYNECPGCFPRYYFLSEKTRACYSEFVKTVPMPALDQRRGNLTHIKAMLMQGVHAIRVLRAHGVEHRDLSFRNILRREVATPNGETHVRLVLFDFGASRPLDEVLYLDGHVKFRGRQLDGNGVHTDLYVLACSFAKHTYGIQNCRGTPVPLQEDTSTLLHAYAVVMHTNLYHRTQPDFDLIERTVRAVVKF